MNTSMIKIEGLTFSYGKKASVFQDFSLEMEAGKVIGLLGKNGTGKSTLLYLMSGLLRPQSGSVWMKERDVQKRLPVTLEDMYLVPEEFTLPNLSLKQFVKVNAPFYPRFSQELLRTCLADFDLNEDIHLGELSMGQKKKAYMCFALAANTSLLLMDEPTNGLDIPSKSQFRKVIASGMLNRSVVDITDKLLFAEQGMNEPTDDALFVQPSVHGNSVIWPNLAGEESPLNLELLFNALLTEREKIQAIFNEK